MATSLLSLKASVAYDGVAAASSDGGPTGGRAPDSSRVLSD